MNCMKHCQEDNFFRANKTFSPGQTSVISDHFCSGFLADDGVSNSYDETKAASVDFSSHFHFPYST